MWMSQNWFPTLFVISEKMYFINEIISEIFPTAISTCDAYT